MTGRLSPDARSASRRARRQLERALLRLARHRSDPEADPNRRLVLPFVRLEVEVDRASRLVDAIVRATGAPRQRIGLAFVSGSTLLEVVGVDVHEDGPLDFRRQSLGTEIVGRSTDGSFQAAVAAAAREALGDRSAPVVAIDVRLAAALDGPPGDALERLARLTVLLSKGLRGRLLSTEPALPGPVVSFLSALRLGPNRLAWLLRRSLPAGRFLIVLDDGRHRPVVALDIDAAGIDLRLGEVAPTPAADGENLADVTRRARLETDANLALGLGLAGDGRTWFVSTTGEIHDLPRLVERIGQAFPLGRELADDGWTLTRLRSLAADRWRRGLATLRRRPVVIEATDGEQYATFRWDGRAFDDGRRTRLAETTDEPHLPVDLRTIHWALGLFFERGPSHLVSIVADRLPEGTVHGFDFDEALLAIDLENPSGQPERVLIAGGTFRYPTRTWEGDATWLHLAGSSGRVLEHRHLPSTPLSIERRGRSVALRLPGAWKSDPERADDEVWILEPFADAPFATGLASLVSPASSLDRLTPGLRSRWYLGSLRLPLSFLHLGGEVRKIVGAAGLVRRGHGLAYASILGTRRATLWGIVGSTDDPWGLGLTTAWPALREAAPPWFETVLERTERRGVLLGHGGPPRQLDPGRVDFDLDGRGRMTRAPAVAGLEDAPLGLSIIDATAVPYDGSGVHLLRIRLLLEAGGAIGFGHLEVPFGVRSVRREGAERAVLEVEVDRGPTGGVVLRIGEAVVLELDGADFTIHGGGLRSRLSDVATGWWRRLGKRGEP